MWTAIGTIFFSPRSRVGKAETGQIPMFGRGWSGWGSFIHSFLKRTIDFTLFRALLSTSLARWLMGLEKDEVLCGDLL